MVAPRIPEFGTAAEKEDFADKIPFNHRVAGVSPISNDTGRANLASTSTLKLDEHMGRERDEGSDNDMEEVFPQASAFGPFTGDDAPGDQPFGVALGSGVSTPGGMPKSMLELAEERMKRGAEKHEASETNGVGGADGGGNPEQGQPPSVTNGRSLRSRGHKMNGTSGSKAVNHASKKKPKKRKRDASEESALTEGSEAENVDEFDATLPDDSGDEGLGDRAERRRSQRSTRGRRSTKSVPTPTPSTRVLRARVPKSPEKLRVQEEAEADLSEALEER